MNDYAILLFEFPYKTLQKVETEIRNRNLDGAKGFVCYDDHYFEPPYEINTIDYAIEVCFHKRKSYAEQQEYRLVIINNKKEKIEDFYIGKLEDDEYQIIEIQKDKDFVVTIKVNLIEKYSDTASKITVDKILYEFIPSDDT